MSNPKPPKQSHIDYLLTTIETDHDKAISQHGRFTRAVKQSFVDGQLTEEEVRTSLSVVKKIVVSNAMQKDHARKLFDATIEYILTPDKKVQCLSKEPEIIV